jgi:hypothetical protein
VALGPLRKRDAVVLGRGKSPAPPSAPWITNTKTAKRTVHAPLIFLTHERVCVWRRGFFSLPPTPHHRRFLKDFDGFDRGLVREFITAHTIGALVSRSFLLGELTLRSWRNRQPAGKRNCASLRF